MEDSASCLSANATTGWKPVGHDRQDACPPVIKLLTSIQPHARAQRREKTQWPREDFIYWTDGGSVAALRYGNWKATFLRQDAIGLNVWVQPFTQVRAPMLTNLRTDPFERTWEESGNYDKWFEEHMFMITPAAAHVAQYLMSPIRYRQLACCLAVGASALKPEDGIKTVNLAPADLKKEGPK
jgi:hypothetical protein